MKRLGLSIIGMILSAHCLADLKPLNEEELQSATGAGLGIALDDFVLSSTDNSQLAITGIGDENGNPITVNWTELYLMGEGSNDGTIVTPLDIGSYNHPWVVRTIRGDADWNGSGSASYGSKYEAIGDDIGLFEFTTSEYSTRAQNTELYVTECVMQNLAGCATDTANRRDGADFGSQFNLVTASRTDYLDLDIKGLYIDGSYIRLWSRPEDGYGGTGLSELNGNLKLVVYAEQLVADPCQNDCGAANELVVDDFYLNLALGYGEIQPVKFDVTSDGNFVIEVGLDPNGNTSKAGLDPRPAGVDENDPVAMKAFYDDFYNNVNKTDIYLGNVQVGSNSIGTSTITGLGIHYLKVTSQDI